VINPDVALTLIETNLETVVNGINFGNGSLIRMADGKPPTPEQLARIMSATVEDFDAANNLWKLRLQMLSGEDGDDW
jgi:hypothetical protein